MTQIQSHDQLHRFVFDECDLRGEILTLNESFTQATEHQNLPPVAKRLLGEFLAATRLISEVLKFEGTLTLQVRGSGPLPLIMAEANDDGNLRGIVKPAENVQINNDASLTELIGNGVLSLTMDPIKGKRYQGIVALEGDNLAEALSAYFAQSEQLATRIWLFADEAHAGGLLLQALPEQQTDKATHEENWRTAEMLADTLTQQELAELEHEQILLRLFHEFTVRVFPPAQVRFSCQCSRERCAHALASLGQKDATALLAERDIIDMGCEFCGAKYVFGEQDLQALFINPNLH